MRTQSDTHGSRHMHVQWRLYHSEIMVYRFSIEVPKNHPLSPCLGLLETPSTTSSGLISISLFNANAVDPFNRSLKCLKLSIKKQKTIIIIKD